MSTYELTPEQKIRQRYAWFQEAQRPGNVKMACLRLGISGKPSTNGNIALARPKESARLSSIAPAAPSTPTTR